MASALTYGGSTARSGRPSLPARNANGTWAPKPSPSAPAQPALDNSPYGGFDTHIPINDGIVPHAYELAPWADRHQYDIVKGSVVFVARSTPSNYGGGVGAGGNQVVVMATLAKFNRVLREGYRTGIAHLAAFIVEQAGGDRGVDDEETVQRYFPRNFRSFLRGTGEIPASTEEKRAISRRIFDESLTEGLRGSDRLNPDVYNSSAAILKSEAVARLVERKREADVRAVVREELRKEWNKRYQYLTVEGICTGWNFLGVVESSPNDTGEKRVDRGNSVKLPVVVAGFAREVRNHWSADLVDGTALNLILRREVVTHDGGLAYRYGAFQCVPHYSKQGLKPSQRLRLYDNLAGVREHGIVYCVGTADKVMELAQSSPCTMAQRHVAAGLVLDAKSVDSYNEQFKLGTIPIIVKFRY